MAEFTGEENHNFSFFNYYYDMPTYEIESYQPREENADVEAFGICFLVICVMIGILDLLLLVTAFSASVRNKSASWYLYHLIFVTVLQVIIPLSSLEIELHNNVGACMFFSFTEWTLELVYSVNLVLMSVEIFATIVAPISKLKSNTRTRYLISMTTAWVSSILFSALVKFFDYEKHVHLLICSHANKTTEILGKIMKMWIPDIVVVISIITGVVLFIRTKRSPGKYSQVITDQISLQLLNEWFAFFMAFNCLFILSKIVLYELHINFFELGMFSHILLWMVAVIVHIGLPLSCFLLEPVRVTCVRWLTVGFKFVTGIKRSSQANTVDNQTLTMESFD